MPLVRNHIGYDLFVHLEIAYLPSELFSLIGVFNRGVHGSLSDPKGPCSDIGPSVCQRTFCNGKTLAFLTKEVLLGHFAVFKNDFTRI